MKGPTIPRLVQCLALAASLASMPGFWMLRADTQVSRFDGTWVGEMQTTFSSGPCGRTYRLEMSLNAGAASGSASRAGERFVLNGEISDDGAISWSATSGRGSASGSGVVAGSVASGDWEDSTGTCAGTFSIERAH